VGKSSLILRFSVKLSIFIKENQFNQNLMNSIGVDFKLKTIEVEGRYVKLKS